MTKKANNDVIGAARDKCDSIPKQSDKGQQETPYPKEINWPCLSRSMHVLVFDMSWLTDPCSFQISSQLISSGLDLNPVVVEYPHPVVDVPKSIAATKSKPL
jgi:hypothetical protein